MTNALANEKFVKVKGELFDQGTKNEIINFSIKVVLDDVETETFFFEDNSFSVWLPANRTAKVFFAKEGYTTKHLVVDASFIPSFAYKKKQTIELNVNLSRQASNNDKITTDKAFVVANFKASEVKFILTYANAKKKPPINVKAPFPSPYSTFKGAKPSDRTLETCLTLTTKISVKTTPYYSLIQGVVFSNMSYCVFNQHIEDANKHLIQLKEINKNNWESIKPFDAPEYATIVLKTLNQQKSTDFLFALGSWVGTSQLMFQSFTSNSKIIIHGKKLINALKNYDTAKLNDEQKQIVEGLKVIASKYAILIQLYRDSIKNKAPLDLKINENFLEIKTLNETIFKLIIE